MRRIAKRQGQNVTASTTGSILLYYYFSFDPSLFSLNSSKCLHSWSVENQQTIWWRISCHCIEIIPRIRLWIATVGRSIDTSWGTQCVLFWFWFERGVIERIRLVRIRLFLLEIDCNYSVAVCRFGEAVLIWFWRVRKEGTRRYFTRFNNIMSIIRISQSEWNWNVHIHHAVGFGIEKIATDGHHRHHNRFDAISNWIRTIERVSDSF